MKCTFQEAAALANRARINGKDWNIKVGDTTVALRLPCNSADPRIRYSHEMLFHGAQAVEVEEGRVTAKGSDGLRTSHVSMWLFREVPVTGETILGSRKVQAA